MAGTTLLRRIVRRVEQLVAAVILVAILWAFAKGYGFFAPVDPMPFDPVGWRGTVDLYDANTPRSRMVDDLIRRLEKGETKESVVATLGPADISGGPCDYYLVGFRGDMIDPWSVAVCYADGAVTEAYLHQH